LVHEFYTFNTATIDVEVVVLYIIKR